MAVYPPKESVKEPGMVTSTFTSEVEDNNRNQYKNLGINIKREANEQMTGFESESFH